jgi:hypothetical protein
VFGNGRTLRQRRPVSEGPNLTTFTRRANPAAAVVTQATRTWNDLFYPVGDPRRGNFAPDCNFVTNVANGECGGTAPSNFGANNVTQRYAEDATTERGFNWESSVMVQHELASRVSAVGYFRRTAFLGDG